MRPARGPTRRPTARRTRRAGSRALPLAIALLLAVVVADLLTGGSALTIVAVTLLAAVAFALVRAATVLARERDDASAPSAPAPELLARSGELLGSSLDPETMLSRIAELAVPDHAELAIVDLLEARRLAARRGRRRRRSGAGARAAGGARALPAGRRVVAPDRGGDPHRRAAAALGDERGGAARVHDVRRALRADAKVGVPERSGPAAGRARPDARRAVVPADASLEPFGPDDVALAHDLARRAALGLDNARLHTELRRAEGRLEAIVENLGEAVAGDRAGRRACASPTSPPPSSLGLESPDELIAARRPGAAGAAGRDRRARVRRSPRRTC